MEARDVVGGARVSQITTLMASELYPAVAMIDPLAVTYAISLKINSGLLR